MTEVGFTKNGETRMSEYIRFELIEQKPKTGVYAVLSKSQNVELGIVKWYAPWRQYCFFPSELIIFSSGCMVHIVDFIKNLHEERKRKKRNG